MDSKKKSSTSKPQTRKVTLSDGTEVIADDNSAGMLRQGKVGKNLLNKTKPDPEAVAAEVTDEFSKLEYPPPKKNILFRKTWGNFIENVTGRDNFKPSHLNTLEILCDLYVELEELNKFLRQHGMAYEFITIAGRGRRMYPEVAQRDKVRAQIQQYSRQLDLFPKKDKAPRGAGATEKGDWD